MTSEEIFEYAEELMKANDLFSKWAYRHIQSCYSQWTDAMEPNECYLHGIHDDLYHTIGINFDYYWLLECKNNQEMTMLLRSWYNKQIHNNA